MRTKTKWWILSIGVVLALLALWFNPWWTSDSTWRGGTATAAEMTYRTEVDVETYTVPRGGVCTQYPNGVLKGWWINVHIYQQPSGYLAWRYGYWGGSFCSNANRLWSVKWGGEPDGYANSTYGWQWRANDSRIIESDTTGDVRSRKWRGHMVSGSNNDWPTLKVVIGKGGLLDTFTACGC